MHCPVCGSDTRMMLQVSLSAPSKLYRQLSKATLRRKDTYIVAALWETTDFICENPLCGHTTDGYGNYVTQLAKENEQLKKEIEELKKKADK